MRAICRRCVSGRSGRLGRRGGWGRRWGWRRALRYAAWCAALPVLNVALLYNYTALFQVLMAGVPALAGGLLGALLRRLKKS